MFLVFVVFVSFLRYRDITLSNQHGQQKVFTLHVTSNTAATTKQLKTYRQNTKEL